MRAASIWREVTKPQESACRPYSPNATLVAPFDRPVMRPFCCLRHLTFLGASIVFSYLPCLREPRVTLGQNLALEDPAFDADGAVGGVGLGGARFDDGAQGVQRDATLVVPLVARHLGAAQAAGAGEADSLGAELHRRLDRLLHGAAERHPALELRGDVLGHQLRVGLGLADLLDVQEDLAVGERLNFLFQGLDAGAALADHDPGTRGEDVDLDLVGGAFDLDRRDARVAQLLFDELLEAQIFMQPLREVLLRIPLGAPAADDAEAETYRMCLLSHLIKPFPSIPLPRSGRGPG